MKILTTVLFIFYAYGFGSALTRFLPWGSLETILLRLGVGLAMIPVIGVILNALGIPLDWRIFLLLAGLGPAISLIKNSKQCRWPHRNFSLPRKISSSQLIMIGVLALFLINVWTYCRGAFVYPYLEDDDSWTHAAGIKYIALEKNINVQPGEFHYINPYPPGYDLTLAILHQTSPSLYWTLKFMNAFIVCLSFLLFYLMTLELTQSKPLALTAMFLLTCLPSYLSHFIWAHSLVVTLFFPAFICLKKSFEDKKFILPGAVCVAGIFLTQPTQSIKFVIMALLLVLAFACAYRKIPGRPILILFLAVVLSLVWYGPVATDMMKGTSRLTARVDQNANYTVKTKSLIPNLFHPSSGSATRSYSLNDYLHIPEYNYVNNPTGIGVPVFFLGILGLVVHVFYLLKKPREVGAEVQFYSFTILSWLIFTFLGTNSKTFNLPVGLFAFRFWMLFAIPLSILSADALLWATQIFDTPLKRKIFFLAMVGLLINTTGIYKYKVNTSWWSYGVYWSSDDEVKAFIWMRKNLPVDTKVFKPLDNFLVIGHDMLCTPWTAEYKENLSNAMELSVDELHKRLTRLGYRYIIISPKETRVYGPQTTEDILRKLTEDTRFKTVYTQGKGTRIFKVL